MKSTFRYYFLSVSPRWLAGFWKILQGERISVEFSIVKGLAFPDPNGRKRFSYTCVYGRGDSNTIMKEGV
jgi:hypothetical protein